MAALLEVVLPVFLIIGAGFVATRRGWFTPDWADGLMKFTQNFAIPCLLFGAISRLDLAAYFHPALLWSYYGPALAMFAAGLFGARMLFSRAWPDCVAIGFCCLFANSVLLGLPITERAYGADALDANFALVSVNAPICYLVGIATMETVRQRGSGFVTTAGMILRAIFRNVLVLALLAGFVVNLAALPVPAVLQDATDLLARAALPAAIFGLGGILAQYRIEGDLPPVLMIAGLTLVAHPALTWANGALLSLPDQAFRSAVVTAAMAPGVNAYVFANMYGVAKRVAASSVLVSTALSVVTVWLWLALLGQP